MNIIMLGAPGSGKGTHGKRLSQYFSIPHISTGDLLRAESEKQTDFGRQIKELIGNGNLVPDAMITELLVQRLGANDVFAGFVLDGYPRTLEQAEYLSTIITDVRVIYLQVDEDILFERIEVRRQHAIEGGLRPRKDDTAEVLEKRLRIYHTETMPLIGYYKNKHVLIDVNSVGHVETVFQDIISHLK